MRFQFRAASGHKIFLRDFLEILGDFRERPPVTRFFSTLPFLINFTQQGDLIKRGFCFVVLELFLFFRACFRASFGACFNPWWVQKPKHQGGFMKQSFL